MVGRGGEGWVGLGCRGAGQIGANNKTGVFTEKLFIKLTACTLKILKTKTKATVTSGLSFYLYFLVTCNFSQTTLDQRYSLPTLI